MILYAAIVILDWYLAVHDWQQGYRWSALAWGAASVGWVAVFLVEVLA